MKILQIILGVILLLPGLCSAFFMLMLPGGGTNTGLGIIWLSCFAVSAVGVMLLRNARQKSGSQNTQPNSLNDKDQM